MIYNLLTKLNTQIVRQWLWKIAPEFVTVETNPEYRSFTKNSILLDPKKRDSDIYKYLDPDGPHRTNRALDNLDQVNLKYFYIIFYQNYLCYD